MSVERDAERYEKAFLALSGVMLVAFLGALFYAAVKLGITLPSRAGEVDPTQVTETAPFDEPGVRRVGPDRYEAVIVAQAWAFLPREVTVPAGDRVTFLVTSRDVLHGFHIEGTRVNAMVIPGQITRMEYTFREPGEHLVVCHEYCGVGHHYMFGTVRVVSPEEYETATGEGPARGDEAAREAGGGPDREREQASRAPAGGGGAP